MGKASDSESREARHVRNMHKQLNKRTITWKNKPTHTHIFNRFCRHFCYAGNLRLVIGHLQNFFPNVNWGTSSPTAFHLSGRNTPLQSWERRSPGAKICGYPSTKISHCITSWR
jgi:hypothetical protein